MTLRIFAWLPFPSVVVLMILAEWRVAEPAGIFAAPILLGPSVLAYLLALPFLVRGLRRISTRRVAAFSALAALLWVVLEMVALWLISGPVWHASSYVSDHLFFWVLPVGPAIAAIWASYRWAVRRGARG